MGRTGRKDAMPHMVNPNRLRRLEAVLAALMLIAVSVSYGADKATDERATGTISGKVVIKDAGPMSGGQVMLFDAAAGAPPSVESFERPPDFVRDTDADGRFTIRAPEGRYYLKAVRRQSGGKFGPPREGDLVYRSMDEKGRPVEYRVEAGKTLSLAAPLEAVPLKAKTFSLQGEKTAIEGIVKDEKGNPVENVIVIAFLDIEMKGKARFVSRKTDKGGRYIIVLPAGTYYLKMRGSFSGRPPETGEIVGYYGDERVPAPVIVKNGERTKRIDIRATAFPGRGPEARTAPANR
ncbi:MAG: carboxypeptidase-like regulatory domain-containing protein [Nitrospiraceae bacterium]|nr:carboxypeptidase-like regulatory domain-containing protein [Nitrospiraceae bacterium]